MADIVAKIKNNVEIHSKQLQKTKEDSATSTCTDEDDVTWESLGVSEPLRAAVAQMKWVKPSKIQKEAIPPALQKQDQARLEPLPFLLSKHCLRIPNASMLLFLPLPESWPFKSQNSLKLWARL